MAKILTIVVSGISLVLFQNCAKPPAAPVSPTNGSQVPIISRSFSMGFTPNPDSYNSPSAQQAAWKHISDHGDLVVLFDDAGIPWQSAYDSNFTAYPSDYLQTITDQITQIQLLPASTEVFLYIDLLSSARTSLAPFRSVGGTTNPAPAPWDTKTIAFSDPMVVQAFANHSNYLISRFHPKYLSLAIEANMMLEAIESGSLPLSAWTNFVAGVQAIYAKVKQTNPQVQILVSLQAGSFYKNQNYQKSKLQPLLDSTDVITVTSYPYMDYNKVSDLPRDYFSALTSLAPTKPFAIAEQGWPAESIIYPDPLPPGTTPGIQIPFTESDQSQYYSWMLGEAMSRKTLFVGVWISQDGDGFWNQIFQYWPEPVRFQSRLFRDLGFFDGTGRARPAIDIWDSYLKYPRQ
ncbi:MAG: hypothetical protein K2X47_08940 [Bdellovibrionales bacterium]|nr:hypothetical protein [Bdellovibrionales bacterium]